MTVFVGSDNFSGGTHLVPGLLMHTTRRLRSCVLLQSKSVNSS